MTARDIALPVAAICAAIICYLIYIEQFIAFAGAAFGIGWLLFKIALAATLVVSAFFLLHPLTFMLRLRGTPAGQRGHVRFTHLFGLLWLDAGLDRRARNVRIGFWRWSWRIAGGRPPRPERKSPSSPAAPPPPSPAPTPTFSTAAPVPAEKAEAPSAPPVRPAAPPQPPPMKSADSTASPKDDMPQSVEEKAAEPVLSVSPAAAEKPATTAAPRPHQEPPEKAPSAPVSPFSEEESVSPSSETSAASPRFEPASPHTTQEEESPSREKPFGDRIRTDLRRLRRRAAEGWRTAKTWLKLGMKGWRRASPLLKRLAADHWNGVHLRPSVCRVRYGLTEAHLTGMTQGLAAPFAGLLVPFSVRFEPIPVFTGPTLHVLVDGGILIQPWRILWAWLVLLTTLDFWKALRDL
ncbi:MAG TPA: hypothetical protein PLY73_13750, partial [Candidatus Ozemobacteraceae bacterium]|nr:hypothetical protein [Candidatus Ozemobacteraceae bacterium]